MDSGNDNEEKTPKKNIFKKTSKKNSPSSDSDDNSSSSDSDDSSSSSDSDDNSSSSDSDDNEENKKDIKLNILKFKMKNSTIECKEEIDVDKLNYIIQNKDKFKKYLRSPNTIEYLYDENEDENKDEIDKEESKYDPFEACEKLLKKSRKGIVKVVHKQSNNIGRYFARRRLSLQNIMREIRQSIATGYIDIDVSNAGPTILKFICDYLKIECPILTKYCKNREKFWIDNGYKKETLKQDNGKQLFINIIFGAKIPLKDDKKGFIEFMKEIERIQNELANIYEKEYKNFEKKKLESSKDKDHTNIKGKFTSIIIQDFENQILQCMYSFFGKPKSAILCFDGLMIKKHKKENYEKKLRECEKIILNKLGIKIELKIKEFEDKFPDKKFVDVPKYKEMKLKYFGDFAKLTGKTVELEVAEELLQTMTFIDKGGADPLVYTKHKKIDYDVNDKIIWYDQCTLEGIKKMLKNIPCNIINPNFNDILYKECKNDTTKINTLTSEEKRSIQKYLYTTLSSPKGDGFFDVYHTNRKKKDKYEENIEDKYPSVRFEQVVFRPFLERKGKPNIKDAFNLFTGFPLEKVKLKEKLDLKKFTKSHWYTHMKNGLCNGDKNEFNNLLDWLAIRLQEPMVLIPAQLFFGIEGTGKGTFVEFLKRLFGSSNVCTIENFETYLDKFNVDTSLKIIKVLEEVEDKGKAHKNHNIIKADIKKTTEFVEDKFKTRIKVEHFCAYIFNTNNRHALKIPPKDRRFTCHSVSENHADDMEYYDKIYKEINDEQFMKTAFEFFAERTYEKNKVKKAYQNAFKISQKLENTDLGPRCIKDIIEEDNEIPKIYILDEQKVVMDKEKNTTKLIRIIDASYIHAEYKKWTEANTCYFNLTVFMDQNKKQLGLEKNRYSRNGKKTYGYLFDYEELKKKYNKIFDIGYFEFDIKKVQDLKNEEDNILQHIDNDYDDDSYYPYDLLEEQI